MRNAKQLAALVRLNLVEFSGYFVVMPIFLILRLAILHFFDAQAQSVGVFLILNLIVICSWVFSRDFHSLLCLPLGKNPRRSYIVSLYAVLCIAAGFVSAFLAITGEWRYAVAFFHLTILFGALELALGFAMWKHRNLTLASSSGALAAAGAAFSVYSPSLALQISPVIVLVSLLISLLVMEVGIRVFQRKDV